MKKITLFIALMTLPFLAQAQTWDFTNTDDGFEAAQATLTVNAESISLEFVDDKTPKLRRQADNPAGIDPLAVNVAAITLRNPSLAGIMKVKHDKLVSGGNRFVALDITPSLDEFVTYYVELANAEWDNDGAGGVQDNFELTFKDVNNENIPTAGLIEIDKIEMLDGIPTTEKLVYEFETVDDSEGWTSQGASEHTVADGTLTLDFLGNNSPKIIQEDHHVNAVENVAAYITIKNNSTTDNQMRVSYPKAEGGRAYKNVEITTGDTGFTTYGIDVTGPDWTGIVSDIQVHFRNAENTSSDGTGNVEIELIEFNNEAVLSVESATLASLSMFPNPAKNFVTINAVDPLASVEMYDVTGKLVLQYLNVTESFDVSSLNSGIYLARLTDVAGNSITRKLVINK